MTLQNWARNFAYSTERVYRPANVEEVRDAVRREKKLRVVGTRHSFSRIADSTEALVSTEKLTRIVRLDREARTVTIEPGVTYGQLGPFLEREGFALPNLASLPHISVAGAVATGTHGSGVRNGNLATSVTAMELVTAAGEMVTMERHLLPRDVNPVFFTGCVHLGALGVVTRLTLRLEPSFAVRQTVYDNLPFARLKKDFDAIMSAAYSVSLFTDWASDTVSQVWLKDRVNGVGAVETPRTFFGATAAPADRHPITALSAENCTPQMGVAGPWHERLPHFRMDFTPSSGDELQTEYFVPLADGVAALRALNGMREQIAPLLLISEIRTIARDDFAMSPCHGRDSLAIHFTWKPDAAGVMDLLPKIEAALEPFAVRPHWGKLFRIPPAVLWSRYPAMGEFLALARKMDPAGKFRNQFLNGILDA